MALNRARDDDEDVPHSAYELAGGLVYILV